MDIKHFFIINSPGKVAGLSDSLRSNDRECSDLDFNKILNKKLSMKARGMAMESLIENRGRFLSGPRHRRRLATRRSI